MLQTFKLPNKSEEGGPKGIVLLQEFPGRAPYVACAALRRKLQTRPPACLRRTPETAEWVWGPTPGPFRKSKEMRMALVMWLMSQLQAAAAEVIPFRVGRGDDREQNRVESGETRPRTESSNQQ